MWKVFFRKQDHIGSTWFSDEIDLEIRDINQLDLARQKAREIINQNRGECPKIVKPKLVWIDVEAL